MTYFLFVGDPNGHFLREYRGPSERGRPKALPVAAHFGGKRIFDSVEAPAERTMQLVSEVEGISREADLDGIEYRVRLPFEAGGVRERVLKGHGRDFEGRREHFQFEGPKEVADSAGLWLDGAEKAYGAMRALLGHDTTRREKGEVQGIRIQAMMPPGVGAFAGGGNTTFPVGSAFAMTRPERILNVPFLHELLHTFAHGHKDYMEVTCRETGVRMYGGSPAARFVSNPEEQRELLRCLRGEATPNPERVIGSLLLRECGYDIFLKYFEKGRPIRERLWAAGLTEPEADCAIFDWLADGRARGLFAAAGASLRDSEVDRGVAMLGGDCATTEIGAGAGPDPKRSVGRAIGRLEQMLKGGRRDEAPAQVDRIRGSLDAVSDYRFRADVYCRVGEILFKADLKEPAYAMLKDCQRAAARVGTSFVPRARAMCMKVLKGEPTRTLM